MQELRTTATFTSEQAARDDALTTIVARSVLEAALAEGEPAELWFDLASDRDDEVGRLSIDLAPTDLEQLLGLSSEDEIAMSLDGESIESLFGDPDVEAHSLKGPIAIVVTSAAILAPAGQAAVTQGVGAAATTQRTSPAVSAEAHTAAKAEVIGTATKAEVIGTATKAEVIGTATKAEVIGTASKAEVTKTLVVKASGFKLLRAKLFR
jgi:hypothetical protein